MKSLLFASALVLTSAASLWAQPPVIGDAVYVTGATGTIDGQHTGQLTLDGTENYWWFCIQNDGSQGPGTIPGGYAAELTSIEYGWSHQYQGRFTESGGSNAGLTKQATIIGYILDNYIPWEDAGPSERFLEITGNPETDNVDFFNAFDAGSHYITQMIAYSGAGTGLERTDFVSFNPINTFDNATPGNAARQQLFNTIVSDIMAKDGAGFFSTYSVLGDYAVVNTEENHSQTNVAQDLIIIMGVPVPEPSTGFLALGSALLLLNRRRRA